MKRLSLDAMEFERVMRLLHMHELASFQATFVETTPSAVWRDYLRVSYRLHVSVEPRALVVADTLVEALKRSGRDLSREKLIANLEGLNQFETGVTPAITYGPNRRIGALGAYVISVDLQKKQFVPASSWIGID